MKTMKLLTVALLISAVVLTSQAYAQNVGKASSKQKQENLEKIKAHQAEMQKKYNSMTPEQKVEAKRRADEYKRSGGKKTTSATAVQTGREVKNPGTSAVVSRTSTQPKQGNVKKAVKSTKPILMDENGKPKKVVSPVTVQPAKSEINTAKTTEIKRTTEVKKTVAPSTNTPAITKTPVKPSVPNGKKVVGVKVK